MRGSILISRRLLEGLTWADSKSKKIRDTRFCISFKFENIPLKQ